MDLTKKYDWVTSSFCQGGNEIFAFTSVPSIPVVCVNTKGKTQINKGPKHVGANT
jgi:hypothetical protein